MLDESISVRSVGYVSVNRRCTDGLWQKYTKDSSRMDQCGQTCTSDLSHTDQCGETCTNDSSRTDQCG